jgi:predicted GNAT superfamily acetyltransferase
LAISYRIISDPQEIHAVEKLQSLVWPGDATEIVPAHLLIAALSHGGVLIGAYDDDPGELEGLVGFVFGFPGFYETPDGPRLMHYSHLLGIHPQIRDRGLGFKLKRAQWQMVRHQGIDRISWTFDPLQSRNANLNINKLGAVCNTYWENYYGDLRDDLNLGVASDRFQVDWWVNTQRVFSRLSKTARPQLDLANYLDAGAQLINPSTLHPNGYPEPCAQIDIPVPKSPQEVQDGMLESALPVLLLVEIPSDFLDLKAVDFSLAQRWRKHTRQIFIQLFELGYLVTDFIHLRGEQPRSFYVLSYGESTL